MKATGKLAARLIAIVARRRRLAEHGVVAVSAKRKRVADIRLVYAQMPDRSTGFDLQVRHDFLTRIDGLAAMLATEQATCTEQARAVAAELRHAERVADRIQAMSKAALKKRAALRVIRVAATEMQR